MNIDVPWLTAEGRFSKQVMFIIHDALTSSIPKTCFESDWVRNVTNLEYLGNDGGV